MPQETQGRIIQSIQRAFDIVECFTNKQMELSLNDISKMVQLNKSTVHSILNTLLINGYISQNQETGKYMLGKKFISKSLIVPYNQLLKNFGEKYIETISEKHKVTSHLLIYEHKELYTLKLYMPVNAYYLISSIIGKRIPFHATASGKIILAYMKPDELEYYLAHNPLRQYTHKTITDIGVLKQELEKIRRQGYSMEDEEVENGVISLACPIHKQIGEILGTVSVSASVSVETNIEEIIADLKTAATKISQEFRL